MGVVLGCLVRLNFPQIGLLAFYLYLRISTPYSVVPDYGRILNSPEHPHAQPLNMVHPASKSRPSYDRYRISQSHLPHPSPVQCSLAPSLGTFNLFRFRSSGFDGIQVVPGDSVPLRFPHCSLVGLQFVPCRQEMRVPFAK